MGGGSRAITMRDRWRELPDRVFYFGELLTLNLTRMYIVCDISTTVRYQP
jgi:hypothetical protein